MIGKIANISFRAYNDEQKKRIIAKCTPANHVGRGLTADVYDLGNNTVAKVYRSQSRAHSILEDLMRENHQLSSLNEDHLSGISSVSFPKQHGAFIDIDSGRTIAIYDKVRGKTFGDVGLKNPTVAKKYIKALDDIEDAGFYHVDIKPDNLMLEDEDI